MLTVQKTCALRHLKNQCSRRPSKSLVLGRRDKKGIERGVLHCTVNVNVDGLTERPILRTSRSTISQVDNPGVVTEELSTIFGDFPRNSVGILDVPLAKVFEHATETVIPALLLLGRLTGVGGSELNKQSVTY